MTTTKTEAQWYHVTVVRSTMYKVKATSEEEAIDSFDDADEVDGATLSMEADVCGETDAEEYEKEESA